MLNDSKNCDDSEAVSGVITLARNNQKLAAGS